MPEQLSPEVIDQTADVTLADVTDQDALLAELASLSPIDYDQRRESAAKLLGVRMSTLDAAVAAQRSKLEEQHVTAQLATATPAPWTDVVDGAHSLTTWQRYIVAMWCSLMGLPRCWPFGPCIPMPSTRRHYPAAGDRLPAETMW